jgi:hypothetical protein
MKYQIIEFVLKTLLELIMNLLKKSEETEKAVKELEESTKKDTELAQHVREMYPTLSDEAIRKELC